MKALHYILIALILLIAVFAGVYFFQKKKKVSEIKPDVKPEKQEKKKNTQYSESVKNLQLRINSLLPPDYPPLVVDGIYGDKTDAAVQYVNNLKNSNSIPVKKDVTNESGIKITVNTDVVWNNVKSLGKFLATETPLEYTGLGMLAKLF